MTRPSNTTKRPSGANGRASSARPHGSRKAQEAEQRVRNTHLAVTIGVTALASLAYLVVLLLKGADLPATMATHFGLSGVADGFMRTPTALLFQAVAVIGVPAALLIVFGVGQWWRGEGARLLSALITGLSTGLTTLFVIITLRHVGVEDPTTITLDLTSGAVALGVGAIAAVLAGLVLPPALPRPPSTPVAPLKIAPSDRVSWFGAAHTSRAALIVLACAVLALAGAAIATSIAWLWLLVLVMVLLVLAMTRFTVTIDARGVAWRSALGFPRGTVALSDVVSTSVIDVNPGDFGGYGLRLLPGRLGIITRSGRALRVERSSGALVVTVDDAETAAGVLEGLRLSRRR